MLALKNRWDDTIGNTAFIAIIAIASFLLILQFIGCGEDKITQPVINVQMPDAIQFIEKQTAKGAILEYGIVNWGLARVWTGEKNDILVEGVYIFYLAAKIENKGDRTAIIEGYDIKLKTHHGNAIELQETEITDIKKLEPRSYSYMTWTFWAKTDDNIWEWDGNKPAGISIETFKILYRSEQS